MTAIRKPVGAGLGRRGRRVAALLLLCPLTACAGQPAPTTTTTGPVPVPGPQATRSPPGAGPTNAPSPTPSSTVERSITIVAGGDVLLHEPTWAQADADAGAVGDATLDFTPTLAGIEPVVAAADLALCHLEAPLAPAGGPYAGYPAFSMPPQIVEALAVTGFDACSVASNHTADQGLDGVHRTVTQLRAGGVLGYGAADGAQPANPSFVTVSGVTVGLLSYTYGSNVAVPRADVLELLDPRDMAVDARLAREAGAEIVVVSVHWGTEYDHEPNAQQREVADQLAAMPDVDVVIGHHAHVVQPIVQIGRTWVAYGLGNLLAAQATPVPANREGVLVRFALTERAGGWVVTEAGYVPTYVEREPALRVVVLGDGAAADDRHREALARTRDVVRESGASAGLVEVGTGE